MPIRDREFDASDMAKHPSAPKGNPSPAEVERFARHGAEDGPNKFEAEKLRRQRSGNSSSNR